MGSDLDCCVGVEDHDQALSAAIELDVMKKTLESHKKANRHFKVQKETEIRKYRQRICVLEEERVNLMQRIQNESVAIRVETKEEEESNTNQHAPPASGRHSSDMDLVAGTSPSSSTDSIIHVNHDQYGAL